MFKEILVHIKYPYATAVIAIVWLGTFALYMLDGNLPIVAMVIINSLLTLIITKHAMS